MPDITGEYFVKLMDSALHESKRLWPRTRDRMEIRRHALKLRYWPKSCPVDEHGVLLDMDWCWIKSLRKKEIGELRIDDRIGGLENIRLIFWVAREQVICGLPVIWILHVMPKKRQEFTKPELDAFDVRRLIVKERGQS